MRKNTKIYVIKINRNKLILLTSIVLLILITIFLRNSRTFEIFKYRREKTIVIDPGHGGIDGGTSDSEGLLEKDINLDIGLKLRKEFRKDGFKTVMTREKDMSLEEFSDVGGSRYRRDLNARKDIVNESEPITFVSIHVNSSKKSNSRGVQVYYYPGSNESKRLAESICKAVNVNVYGKLLNSETLEAEVISQNYFILRETEYPGVLVEVGFITNSDDNKLLKNNKYRKKVAYSIKEGVKTWIETDID